LILTKPLPYDFYQYWRNIDDADVEKCLALLTFLPMDEVRRLGALKDSAINEAKVVLAYEVTKLVHGEEEAKKAKAAAEALFSGGNNMEDVPTISVTPAELNTSLIDILTANKVFVSKSEARRTIQQGGLTLGDKKVTEIETKLTNDLFDAEKSILVRKGKKEVLQISTTIKFTTGDGEKW